MVGDDGMKHIYTSMDIGSDSIKVVVCELFQNKLNLLAASSYPSKGIKKGLITDVEAASASIRGALHEVEGILGIPIQRVIASIPSYFAEYSIVKGKVDIPPEVGVITSEDVTSVISQAIASKSLENREFVTMLPVDFRINEELVVKDPTNHKATSLSVRGVLVTTPKKNVYSVISLLESLGIEVVDITLNNIGDFYAFRNKEIENKIGTIINIGSETTTVSLYNKGIIVKSSVVPMGGRNIDNDISYMYKTTEETSRRVKETFALANKRNANTGDMMEISTSVEKALKVNQFEVSEIVSSRLEEILNLAKKEMNILTSKQIDYMIITGGTSNMIDIEYTASLTLGKNVSIGAIKLLGIRDNKFSSCVGNIVYFISKLKLRGKNYTMIGNEESSKLATVIKSSVESSKDSMLGKLFAYFSNEQ